jgi:hypothetical protein
MQPSFDRPPREAPRHLVWLGLVVLAACSLPESQAGALGNGSFAYECVDQSDAFCPSTDPIGSGGPFPSVVALGSTFIVNYVASQDGESFPVVPVSASFVTSIQAKTGVVFQAVRPGSPWLAALADDGRVQDIASVTFAPLSGIDLYDSDSTVWLANVGETHHLTASGVAAGSAAAGTIPYVWSVTSGAKLLSNGKSPIGMDVVFDSPGQVTVTVSALGATGNAVFTVQP